MLQACCHYGGRCLGLCGAAAEVLIGGLELPGFPLGAREDQPDVGSVWRLGEHLLQRVDRGIGMAGLQLRPAQPLQHPEIAGSEPEAAREAGNRRLVIAAALQAEAEVGEGDREIGPELQGLLQGVDRRVGLAQLLLGGAKVAQGEGVAGVQLQRLLQAGDRLLVTPAGVLDGAEQGQGRGGIGTAGEHLTAERLRLGPFATLGELTGALESGQGNGRGVDAVSRSRAWTAQATAA